WGRFALHRRGRRRRQWWTVVRREGRRQRRHHAQERRDLERRDRLVACTVRAAHGLAVVLSRLPVHSRTARRRRQLLRSQVRQIDLFQGAHPRRSWFHIVAVGL